MTPTPATSRELYLRLLGYVRPYWRVLALGLVTMAATAATEPLFPPHMTRRRHTGLAAKRHHNRVRGPLAIVGIFLARGVLGYLSSYCMAWVSNRVITELRAAMFGRLIRLPSAYFHDHASSIPMTRISYDVSGVASAATSVITVLVRDTLTVIGLLGWLFYLNWKLTLVTLVLIPIVAVVIRSFSGRLRSMSRAAQTGTAVMTQVLQESIACNRVVKVFGGEEQEMQRFGKANRDLRGYAMRQAIAAAATVPIVQMFASIALAVVVYAALLQSANDQTTVGSFVSFVTAMLMLLAPLKRLSDVNAPLQRGLAAAESVFTLLDEAPEKDRGTVTLQRAKGRIQFEDVAFRYPSAQRPALSRISLTIESGETVALVGSSGSGKTTFANLLPRFLQPSSGRILLDGHDLQELTLASLRGNIALVSQDVMLFNDTVAANIAYGVKRAASREAVEAAVRAAYATDFIAALPRGLDTPIGENGARLSGGQRQRLAIARALLKDAPLLILDEATSALDSESERQVQMALEVLMKNRTTLVIAHRLSTVERADRIVVLQQGGIVEIGTHRELLARDGVYAQLYKLQFAAEREGADA